MFNTQYFISGAACSRFAEQSCRLHLPFSGGEIQAINARSRRITNAGTDEPSTGELVTHLRDLLGSALTESSKKIYHRAWRVFQSFYHRFYGSSTPKLPLPSPPLALFISYLSARKLAPSTITSYLLAISYVHKLNGHQDPTKSFLIHKLLTALSRQRSVDLRLPITRPVLHELVKSLRHTNSLAFQRYLYSAMFLLAFYGFFRIGELAAKSADCAASLVQYKDLKFLVQDDTLRMIKITITECKHNTNKQPFEILIEREDTQPFCPVQALVDYCRQRGSDPGPLFCQQSLVPISVYQFNTELSRCLNFCGLDASRYKGHSFRIGAASHAADKGFSDAQIRTLGRWKSEAFRIYIRSERLHAN